MTEQEIITKADEIMSMLVKKASDYNAHNAKFLHIGESFFLGVDPFIMINISVYNGVDKLEKGSVFSDYILIASFKEPEVDKVLKKLDEAL